MTTNSPNIINATEIRDIAPPVVIPSGWEWLWWALAAVVVLAVVFALWWWRRHALEVPATLPIPAHVRARQKLKEALALLGQPKPFCILVSDTIRGYLEERFDFRAPERTTEEFLVELRGTNLLTSEQKQKLGEFLEQCDLVKFAKYEPGESELRALHDSAMRLVEESVPTHEDLIVNGQGSGFSGKNPYSISERPERGRILACIGVALQVAPFLWVIAYFITIYRLLRLMGSPHPDDFMRPSQWIHATNSELNSILGGGLAMILSGAFLGLFGLILLIIALVWLRYRAEWFFWFSIIYGVLLLLGFPFGTPFGIFLLVYALTKRNEFLDRR